MAETIKILIVDDHELVREGLKVVLQRQPHFSLVGEADTPDDAVEKASAIRPDVVIMDIRFPKGSGIEACREIVQNIPNCKVIMLTSYVDDEAVFASIMAGASGYVLKQIGSLELVNAVRLVYQGGSLLDPVLTQKVIARMKNLIQDEQKEGLLTLQEKKILALIAEGKTNKEIAAAICLGQNTVRNYVSTILDKLGLSNRAQAAAYVTKHGI
ncbi:MAG: response regulator transcription factor [Ruminiclostridium sp.]|nr:response regulator transcription factor [Ruminiclostridium sp.]